MPEVFFNGPAGRLEGRFHPAKQRGAPIAVVLHPHPQFGGTMNNQIVYNTYYSFAERGFSVLRFNFRGVGRSQGAFDHGQGELSDAASALDWGAIDQPGGACVLIAGVSFGSWIGMQLLMRRPESRLHLDRAAGQSLRFQLPRALPVLGPVRPRRQGPRRAAQGSAGAHREAEDPEGISIEHAVIANANHFFEDCIENLQETVGAYLDKRSACPGTRPACPQGSREEPPPPAKG